MKVNLSPHDFELLSAYIDGQLSPSDKEKVEITLRSDADFQKAFEKLKRSHEILHAVPQRHVPHPFTLTPENVKPITHLSFFVSVFRYSSVAATALLVILIAFDFIPFLHVSFSGQTSTLYKKPVPVGNLTQLPSIINRNTPGYGMGGGGGQPEVEPSLASPLSVPNQQATPAEKIQSLMQTTLPQLETTLAPRQPAAAPAVPQLESIPEPTPTTGQPVAPPASQTKVMEDTLTVSGPILGIRPTEERGQMKIPSYETGQLQESQGVNILRISEISLAFIAVFAGIMALIFARKPH
jgi:hypothetical protein